MASAKANYRPEIQGLRAVAALLVASYHIWLGRVSGGVDVFFTISAFLITTSLLRQVESKSSLSVTRFWGGLARRLLPTASLVLIAVVLASIAFLPRPLWGATLGQTLASCLQLTNWKLAFDAVDYLAQGQSASPVQHYWALSAQWQFYLLWPCLFLVAMFAQRHWRVPLRTAILWLVAVVFAVSFTWSVVATRNNQAFTYFNTFARLWEFCIGAVIALTAMPQLPRVVRVALGWVALCGIVSCGLVLQVSRVFPGYAALWPVGCAALLLLTGTSGSRFGADRLLASRPLVQLGNLSYGLYLWHWPVLVFWRWRTDHADLSLPAGLAVLGIGLILAWGTARLFEHRADTAATPCLLCTLLRTTAPALAITLLWGGYIQWQRSYDSRPVAIGGTEYPGALAWRPETAVPAAKGIPPYPGMLAVSEDWPVIYNDGCYRPDPHWEREHCIYGAPAARRTIALVGGSHVAQWLPALDLIARASDWRIVVYTKSGCVFSVEMDRISHDSWCREWNEGAIKLLLQDRPQIVVTNSTRESGADEYVPEGFVRRWQQLTGAGMEVIAIRDTPWIRFWVPECLEVKGLDSAACAQPRSRMLAAQDPVRAVAARLPHVHFIDMSEYFCDTQTCPPIIGNIIVYRDDSHVTTAYARSLVPVLEPKLRAILAQVAGSTP